MPPVMDANARLPEKVGFARFAFRLSAVWVAVERLVGVGRIIAIAESHHSRRDASYSACESR